MTELQRRGLAENTVITYGSDHGLLMGEYGMGGKALLYDLAMKIPCFIHDPRLPAELQGRTLDPLVSSVDITRAILDYAGVPAPEFMDGASLRPLVEDEEIPWRDELFLESLFAMRDTPLQEGMRRGKWKYIRMFDGRRHIEEHVDFAGRTPECEMLFDLEADPQEKNNLAAGQATAEVRAVLTDLRRRTAEHSKALNHRRSQYPRTVEVRRR
jgi:arylsulfatase A-like enzyme